MALFGDVTEDVARDADKVSEDAGSEVGWRAEAHVEAPQDPDDEHRGEAGERHQHGVHRPFPRDEAPIEDCEAGQAH